MRIGWKRSAGAFSKGREAKQSVKLLSHHVQNSFLTKSK